MNKVESVHTTVDMLVVLIDTLEAELDVLKAEVKDLNHKMAVVLEDHTMQHAMAVHKMKAERENTNEVRRTVKYGHSDFFKANYGSATDDK